MADEAIKELGRFSGELFPNALGQGVQFGHRLSQTMLLLPEALGNPQVIRCTTVSSIISRKRRWSSDAATRHQG